jgi:hypothetical protein
MAHNGDGVHAVINRIARTALNQPIDIDGVQSRGALFKRFQTGRSSAVAARLATASPADSAASAGSQAEVARSFQ